jgi:hypothetical protein
MSPTARKYAYPILLALLVLVLLLLLSRQQSANRQLQVRIAQLEARQAATQQPDTATPLPGAPGATAEEQAAAQTVAVPPPAPQLQDNQLILQHMEVQPVDRDEFPRALTTTLLFHPTKSNSTYEVAFLARVPKTSMARILDLKPVDATPFENPEKSVNASGKFAIYRGFFRSAAPVAFQLTVSEPVTVDVRGTCGIGPFKINLAVSGATVESGG